MHAPQGEKEMDERGRVFQNNILVDYIRNFSCVIANDRRKRSNLFILVVMIVLYSPLAEASIIIRLMGANPSKESPQKIELKTYLPKEVEPEHVLSRDDLQLNYDTQQGAYYVFGEYDLAPGGVIEREVELKDIWQISTRELDSLREETLRTTQLLEHTQFQERAVFLKQSIDDKLDEINHRQQVAAVNPQKHISDYRENMDFLESAKTDLLLARSLLAQVKPISSLAIWKIFLGVAAFLGFLGIGFYFLWQRQIKTIDQVSYQAQAPQSADADILPDQKSEAEEKKFSAEDIEKMMGRDDET